MLMCIMLEVVIFLLGESYWREVDRIDESEVWWVAQRAKDYKILSVIYVGSGLLLVVASLGML